MDPCSGSCGIGREGGTTVCKSTHLLHKKEPELKTPDYGSLRNWCLSREALLIHEYPYTYTEAMKNLHNLSPLNGFKTVFWLYTEIKY